MQEKSEENHEAGITTSQRQIFEKAGFKIMAQSCENKKKDLVPENVKNKMPKNSHHSSQSVHERETITQRQHDLANAVISEKRLVQCSRTLSILTQLSHKLPARI